MALRSVFEEVSDLSQSALTAGSLGEVDMDTLQGDAYAVATLVRLVQEHHQKAAQYLETGEEWHRQHRVLLGTLRVTTDWIASHLDPALWPFAGEPAKGVAK